MDKTYIMLKDKPVLEIENYTCRVLDYDRLPVSLRYEAVSFDDVMHGWTENRTMSIGKTNAKKLLAGFGIRQSNPYLIAKMFHFASLTDCYWMKEEGEEIGWEDINLFANPLEKTVSASALLGVNPSFPLAQKIHTPELTAQGMAAKAWIREEDGLYLYKIGKKELAASYILDILGISQVRYTKADADRLHELADQRHIDKIRDQNEEIVRCKIITSEETAIFPWEDFQVYCAYHELDEFEYVKANDGKAYCEMQVADYILGNEDRHGANFGFFMDNGTGALLHLYPLMDHDHAFSNEQDIPSQTSEGKETLREAALKAREQVDLHLHPLLHAKKPGELSEEQWNGVLWRAKDLELSH